MGKRKLTDEQIQHIIARYLARESPKTIASDYGVHASSIKRVLKQHGVLRTLSEAMTMIHSKDQVSQIIERYINRESPTIIALDYGVTSGAILRLLRKQGVQTRSQQESQPPKLPEEYAQQIIDRYNNFESCLSIARDFGATDSAVRDFLKRHGIARRTKWEAGKKVTLNERCFDEPLNEAGAYWIGFLMADGCVSHSTKTNQSPTISLVLHEKDAAHVIAFRDFLGSTHKLTIRSGAIGVSMRSRIIAAQLAEYGVVPRKSLIATPSLSLIDNRHFWRGAFDGDGSIYFHHNNGARPSTQTRFKFVGSLQMVTEFKGFLRREGIQSNASIYSASSIFEYKLAGHWALKAASILYDGATIYLPRKYERYLIALKNGR